MHINQNFKNILLASTLAVSGVNAAYNIIESYNYVNVHEINISDKYVVNGEEVTKDEWESIKSSYDETESDSNNVGNSYDEAGHKIEKIKINTVNCYISHYQNGGNCYTNFSAHVLEDECHDKPSATFELYMLSATNKYEFTPSCSIYNEGWLIGYWDMNTTNTFIANSGYMENDDGHTYEFDYVAGWVHQS